MKLFRASFIKVLFRGLILGFGCILPQASYAASRVFFIEPKDGATVANELKVKFGLEGMTIKLAGKSPDDKSSGHHHLVIDGMPIPAGQLVPTDSTHLHFGKGQTETSLKLGPGEHSLTLQFADGAHRSYGPEMSATIKVSVK